MKLFYATPLEAVEELGARLKAHRIACRYTQAELARRVGVQASTISNLEKGGNTSFLTVVAVAQVLGLGEQLDPLFEYIPASIAALEQAEKMPKRVRARR